MTETTTSCPWTGLSPFSREYAENPFTTLAAITHAGGVVEVADGLFVVSSYELCKRVARDWRHFSSSPAGFVEQLRRFGLAPTPEEARQLVEDGLIPPSGGMSEQLVHHDPPKHTEQRMIVSRSFTQSVLEERWLADIDETIADLAASFVARGSTEFVGDFAVPLPIVVITRMLGVPHFAVDEVKSWSDAWTAASDPSRSAWVRKATAVGQMERAFRPELEARLNEPCGDVLSDLAMAVVDGVDGQKLTIEEALEVVYLLLVAGNETVTQLIAGTMYELVSTGQWSAVAEQPDLIASAVEETLRVFNPIISMMRFVRDDAEIDGTRIPAGSIVMLSYAGANRDGRKFPEPTCFRPDRDNANHNVAFGFGIHHCLGAPLARLEAVRTLEHLAPRIRDVAIAADDAAEFGAASQIIRGLTRLPLTFASATARA